MLNAQEWLDKEYPLEKRTSITKLNIREKNLTGTLDVTTFSNLEVLNCFNNNLTNLVLPTNSQLKEINCQYNELTSLIITGHSYLTTLDCRYNNQLTNLAVINNPQLAELYCSSCNLSNLTLTNNLGLAILLCYNNQLTSLHWLTNSNNQDSLTHLSISENKLTGDLAELAPIFNQFTKLERLGLGDNTITGDLVALSKLVNLQALSLNDTSITGSLQSLQNCIKLKDLRIKNTLIKEGSLEYLPASLEYFYCEGTKWVAELADYKEKNYSYYNYQAWRKDHPELIEKAQIQIPPK